MTLRHHWLEKALGPIRRGDRDLAPRHLGRDKPARAIPRQIVRRLRRRAMFALNFIHRRIDVCCRRSSSHLPSKSRAFSICLMGDGLFGSGPQSRPDEDDRVAPDLPPRTLTGYSRNPSSYVITSGSNVAGVDRRLADIVEKAAAVFLAANPGYRVAFSGKKGRATGTTNYPSGRAIDVRIIDPKGRKLPNSPQQARRTRCASGANIPSLRTIRATCPPVPAQHLSRSERLASVGRPLSARHAARSDASRHIGRRYGAGELETGLNKVGRAVFWQLPCASTGFGPLVDRPSCRRAALRTSVFRCVTLATVLGIELFRGGATLYALGLDRHHRAPSLLAFRSMLGR